MGGFHFTQEELRMDQRQRSLGRGVPGIAQTFARANRVVTSEDEDVLLIPTAHLGVVPYLGADDVDGLETVGLEKPRPNSPATAR